jgi:hypothetical protein
MKNGECLQIVVHALFSVPVSEGIITYGKTTPREQWGVVIVRNGIGY